MKLITITGPSGAGKDTVARMLSELTGYKVLCSYTTRPKRSDETDGVEHHFVNKCDVPHDKMLAYTQYGGYEYWTTLEQIGYKAIYVIDEDGLTGLRMKFPDMDIYPIYVTAPESVRLQRGVTQERIDRDKNRNFLPLGIYSSLLINDCSIELLKKRAEAIKKRIMYVF